MSALGPKLRVFALGTTVDMRKGFEGLFALCTQQMGRDVLTGDLFLFVGKDRRRAKVLYFDGTGLCVLHKRLSKGRFAAPWRSGDGQTLVLTHSELALFLEGSQLVGQIPLSPPALQRSELRRFSS